MFDADDDLDDFYYGDEGCGDPLCGLCHPDADTDDAFDEDFDDDFYEED